MSRRRSTGRLTRRPAEWVTRHDHHAPAALASAEPVAPWWWATPMPFPWTTYLWSDWQEAWGKLTLEVCNSVWRSTGAKYYDAARNAELRADLQDWLIVQAVEASNEFTPDPWHPQPHLQWASFLRGRLLLRARFHFADVVGTASTPKGRAARLVHSSGGVASLDEIEEEESEGARRLGRGPLHGLDLVYSADPESIICRLESLLEEINTIEREDRRQGGFHSQSTATGAVCLINLCTRPVEARGLCRAHYLAERKAAQHRGDWEPYQPQQECSVEDCDRPHHSAGLCRKHDNARRSAVRDACSVDDCEKPTHRRGLCYGHWAATRQADAPPCTHPDCTTPAATAGLCGTHYQQQRRARARQEPSP